MTNKKELSPDVALSLQSALEHGFHYVVATNKRTSLGSRSIFLLFHSSMLGCQTFIRESELRGSLSFHCVSVILNSPDYFLRNR